MAYSFKGAISFGMVYIPIKLEVSVKDNDISFNQIHKDSGSRVRYKKTCDDCDGKTIQNSDIVKAYQYEADKYVVFSDQDFEKIKTKKDKNIVIDSFVSLDEIDPIFYNKPYYVVPIGAEKAFALLVTAMHAQNKVGIAKTVLGQRETLVALRVRDGRLLLNTLYFPSEIRANPVKEIPAISSGEELNMAAMIIENMTKPFDPAAYKDEYREKILSAIEAKIAGREITAPKEKHENILDLMSALKQSLLNSKPAAKTPNNTKSNNAQPKPKTNGKSKSKTIDESKSKAIGKSKKTPAKKGALVAKGRR